MYKVLFVEDEIGIRSRLIKLIRWEEINCAICGEADSGDMALKLIVEKLPDIIICDIVMPGVNGLTLLEYAREHFPNIIFIIISAYKEFSYIQKAIKLGAIAFLTKPIDPEEFKNTITRIVLTLRKDEYQKLSVSPDEITRDPLCDSFRWYVKNNKTTEFTLEQMKEHIRSHYAVVTFCMNDYTEMVMQEDAFQIFTQIVVRKLKEFGISIYCTLSSKYVVALFHLEGKDFSGDIGYVYTEIQKLCSSIVGFSFSYYVGISAVSTDIRQIPACFKQSLNALDQSFYSMNRTVFVYEEAKQECEPYNAEKLDILIRSMPDSLDRITDLLSLDTQGNTQDPAHYKAIMLSIASMLLQRKCKTPCEYIASNQSLMKDIVAMINAQHREEADQALEHILEKIYLTPIEKSNKDRLEIVQAVYQFIQDHYAEDVYLALAAEAVYLSPSYLSSLIKRYTSKSFTDLLIECRMGKAKNLLKSNLKISEISQMVGYKDPQYFSIAFKNYEGMPPSEYKKQFL